MKRKLIFKNEAKGFGMFFVLALSIILFNTSKLYALTLSASADGYAVVNSLTFNGTPLSYYIFDNSTQVENNDSAIYNPIYGPTPSFASLSNTDSFGSDYQWASTMGESSGTQVFAIATSNGLAKISEANAEQWGTFYTPSPGIINLQISYNLTAQTNVKEAYTGASSCFWVFLGTDTDPFPKVNVAAGEWVDRLYEESSGLFSLDYYSLGGYEDFRIMNYSAVSAGYPNTPANPQVPEPATMVLLGSLASGLFGFAGLRKRFRK